MTETRLTGQNETLILVLREIRSFQFQAKTLLLVLSMNTSVTK